MTAMLAHPHSPRPKKWTTGEYLELVEHGVFDKQRVQLFRGEIIEMAPHGHPHAYAITKLTRYLTTAFPEPYDVRIQLSFVAAGNSVPEPDAAVCKHEDAQRKPHPARAELIIEVADSSLAMDRGKAEEYAGAQVPEYWIINTEARRIEVYRQPVEDAIVPSGRKYAQLQILNVGDQIAPLSRPQAAVAVLTFFA